MNKKRSPFKSSRHLLPTAAALAVAGFLFGGGGLVIKFGAPAQVPAGATYGYDAADYPPADRDAQLGSRATRGDMRLPGTATNPQSESGQSPRTGKAADTGNTDTTQTNLVGNASVIATGSCEASFYGDSRRTASKEMSDPTTLTAGHTYLPFNSEVRVTNVANNKSVVVRINDRGPSASGRCLNLSKAAFLEISTTSAGVADVRYEVLSTAA